MRFSRFALLLIFTLLGCQVLKQAVAPRATAYDLMVKPWHRYGVIKEDVTDMLASADVVFMSCELRKMMVEYKKTVGLVTPAEAEELYRREESTCRAYYDFLVALYTKKTDWNNLDQENPFFRVFLKAEDTVRKPQLVKAVELKDDEISTFYPFVEPWMKVYLVRFGRAGLEDAKELTLELVSLSGRISLTWRLQ